MRAPEVRWLHGSVHFRSAIGRDAPPALSADGRWPSGPQSAHREAAPVSIAAAHDAKQMAYRAIRPAAATWLRDSNGRRRESQPDARNARRLRAAIWRGSSSMTARGGRLTMCSLRPGFASMSRVTISSAPELLEKLKVDQGYPSADTRPRIFYQGLHFMGAPAARSFGPLMRFVSGTGYSARALTEAYRSRLASSELRHEPGARPREEFHSMKRGRTVPPDQQKICRRGGARGRLSRADRRSQPRPSRHPGLGFS